MEVETEVTVKDYVLCPRCGYVFEAELTDGVCVEVAPDDEPGYDPD